MKDFHLIDWKEYNRPPYWQQWMCTGDPEKLARFGDSALVGVNQQVLSLKDTFDLDNGAGRTLDRIGKVLVEPRDGNIDDIYRKFLKLRTMLNTADGTLNNIIKIMKFIYGSREIRIRPEFPAALVIEYDGEEQEYFDYNAILAQVIPAGVGFFTKAMFDFLEDPIVFGDDALIDVIVTYPEHLPAIDASFGMGMRLDFVERHLVVSALVYGGAGQGIIYDRSYLHDGKLKFQSGGAGSKQYNSAYIHDGSLKFDKENYKYIHDGSILYGSGLSEDWALDDFQYEETTGIVETMSSHDAATMIGRKALQDQEWDHTIYDGSTTHNGETQYASAEDRVSLEVRKALEDSMAIVKDLLEYEETRNDDGTETVNIMENESMKLSKDLGESANQPSDSPGNIGHSLSLGSDDMDEPTEGITVLQTRSSYYGNAAPFKYHHDGDILFNSGIAVAV
jgi:hypothetical protein